jgi:prevent-host-death family protein
MTITTLTSLELDQDVGRARKAALCGPVFITDQGRPAHVLLSIEEYQRLTGKHASIADLLAMPGAEAVELEVHPLRDLPKSAGLS